MSTNRGKQDRRLGGAPTSNASAELASTGETGEAVATALPATPQTSSPPEPSAAAVKTAVEAQTAPQRNFTALKESAPPPAEQLPLAQPEEPPPHAFVHVKVIWGDIIRVETPVAVTGRYQRLPFAGQARDFDRVVESWLSRSLELGMIGSGLGEVFLVPMPRKKQEGATGADNLLVMGMGEPGHFAQDDLRYLMSNVTVAVKAMGHEQFSTSLLGSRRSELSVRRAVRGLLEGVVDGFERFRGILQGVTRDKERFQDAADKALLVLLVEPDEGRVQEILEALGQLRADPIDGLELDFARGPDVPAAQPAQPPAPTDLDPEERTTLVRIGRSKPPPDGITPPAPTGRTTVFQFSALAERAAITVREVEVSSYFVEQVPTRLTDSCRLADQEAFGVFLANFLIPQEFRSLIDGGNQLTLVLDESTAGFPWEMAAFPRRQAAGRAALPNFFGTDLRLARQFRTLLSPAPGVSPPLNCTLKVLVIADPAAHLPLDGARKEGLAVVGVLRQAQQAWKGVFNFKVTVRIGPYGAGQKPIPELEALAREGGIIQSARTCDPVELLMLLVNEQYDVVHYAGHGIFEPADGRMGWVFDQECVLSAADIFRVRQVPRLVFANACHSAATEDREEQRRQHAEQRRQQVGLAQAFFARGIQNYIGAGWAVDDGAALDFAVRFYRQILGLQPAGNGDPTGATAPPATLGESLAAARRTLLLSGPRCSTWGAYQHYGRANDKLLPLPNRDDSGED